MNKEFVVVSRKIQFNRSCSIQLFHPSCSIPAVQSQLFNLSCLISAVHGSCPIQLFNSSCSISAVQSKLFSPSCSIQAVQSQLFTVAVQSQLFRPSCSISAVQFQPFKLSCSISAVQSSCSISAFQFKLSIPAVQSQLFTVVVQLSCSILAVQSKLFHTQLFNSAVPYPAVQSQLFNLSCRTQLFNPIRSISPDQSQLFNPAVPSQLFHLSCSTSAVQSQLFNISCSIWERDFGRLKIFWVCILSVYFASNHFVSHTKFSVSLQRETSETSKTSITKHFFAILLRSFSLPFRFEAKSGDNLLPICFYSRLFCNRLFITIFTGLVLYSQQMESSKSIYSIFRDHV